MIPETFNLHMRGWRKKIVAKERKRGFRLVGCLDVNEMKTA